MFILAQVLSLAAGLLMLRSMLGDRGEKFLQIQSLDCICNLLADLILGGLSGAVLCVGSILRNNSEKVERKLGEGVDFKIINYGVILLALIIGVVRDEWFFMTVTSLVYTIFLQFTKDLEANKIKADVIVSLDLAMWFVFDVSIRSIPMACTDVIVLIMTIRNVQADVQDAQAISVAGKREDGITKDVSDFIGSKIKKSKDGEDASEDKSTLNEGENASGNDESSSNPDDVDEFSTAASPDTSEVILSSVKSGMSKIIELIKFDRKDDGDEQDKEA